MSMRLAEVHPAVVHLPIALMPFALAADALGAATGSRELIAAGKVGIVAATLGAAVAGAFGFIAQEEVRVDARGAAVLATHRTMNVLALGAMTALAIVRVRARRGRRPGLGYLLGGLATLGAVGYSAYLGGKLVYHHGAGVAKAGGLSGDGPAITASNAGLVVKTAAAELARGIAHAARDVANGRLVPRPGKNGA